MVGKVLVIGAAGRTGMFLARALARSGASVRALVRDAGRARAVLPPAVELIEGDLRDAATVRDVVGGCETIVFTAGANGGEGRGVPREIEFGAVASLVDAARDAPIRRFVLLSSASVTQPEHPHNCTFNSVLTWKLRGEEALRASGLPYVIVRALGLRDRPAGSQGGVRLVQGDRLAFGEDISREDLGEFLADVAVPPASSRFEAPFDPTSLQGATCEVYNDARIPASVWASSRSHLVRDGAMREQAA